MAVAPADDGLTNAERTARSVYVVACAGCHGAQGHGDGPERAPVMRLPDFASAAWQESLTDDELVSIISLGRGMMPAFGDRIPAEGLRALVGRLRAFGPPPGAPPADDARVEVGVEAEVESDAGVAPTTAPEATTDAGVAPPAP
jgi:mono/diheme cytochrome c family protein